MGVCSVDFPRHAPRYSSVKTLLSLTLDGGEHNADLKASATSFENSAAMPRRGAIMWPSAQELRSGGTVPPIGTLPYERPRTRS